MIQRILFSCVLFLLILGNVFSQTVVRCAYDAFIQNEIKNNTALSHQIKQLNAKINAAAAMGTAGNGNARTTSTTTYPVISIPVVIHIIHNNANSSIGGSNISDAQILSQMPALNADYRRKNADTSNAPASVNAVGADVQFNFCLANSDPNGDPTTGITRTYTSQTSIIYPNDNDYVKSLSYWPSDQYLNIWVCNLFYLNTSQVLLGITQSPGGDTLSGLTPTDGNALTDGILVNYQSFGTTGTLMPEYALGRTVTHEIGHWFGLFHPWNGSGPGDCSETDYCADTPPCSDAFYAAAPACTDNPPNPCTGRRMIEAFMEYSDDGCMNVFTQDQKTRMRLAQILSPRRLALLNSHGCCSFPALASTPSSKSFEDASLSSGGWTDINGNSNTTYTKGFQLDTISAYGNGKYCIAVSNDSIYQGSDSATYKYQSSFISPYFKIPLGDTTYLQFDWAYSPKVANGNTDSVVVYYSTSCAVNSWVPMNTLYGPNFSSTSNLRSSFVPTAGEWKTSNNILPPFSTAVSLQLKFVAYSKGINTFYLDNININASDYISLPSPDNLTINVYPNPTYGLVNIETLFKGQKNLDYKIYNVLGQFVYETMDTEVSSQIKQISLSNFASGLYFILVSDGNQKVVSRIIKL